MLKIPLRAFYALVLSISLTVGAVGSAARKSAKPSRPRTPSVRQTEVCARGFRTDSHGVTIHLPPRNVRTVSLGPIDFGRHSKVIQKVGDGFQIVHLELFGPPAQPPFLFAAGQDSPLIRFHITLTDPSQHFKAALQKTFFAEMIYNQTKEEIEIHLIPFYDRAKIVSKLMDWRELIWGVYRKLGVVSEEEIASFEALEQLLPPERLIYLGFADAATTNLDPFSVIRIFDGSPVPGTIFTPGMDLSVEGSSTDPRTPIERRYPKLDFRRGAKFFFEIGRLAKTKKIDGALKASFRAVASQLQTKFTFWDLVPNDFLEGYVEAEITEAHIEEYLKPVSKGGLGFELLFGPDQLSSSGDEKPKFAIVMKVRDFITRFQ